MQGGLGFRQTSDPNNQHLKQHIRRHVARSPRHNLEEVQMKTCEETE
jgi:hypothetical protein